MLLLHFTVNGMKLKSQNDNTKLASNDDSVLKKMGVDKGDENDIDPLQDRDFMEPLHNAEEKDGYDDIDLVEMELYNEAFHNQNDGEEHDESNNNDDESEPLLVNIKQHDEEFEEAKEQLSPNHYAQKYDRQVIYIESYCRRGRWLDASHSFGWAYSLDIPEENVVDKLGVKWCVRNVGGGEVVLESMRYKHHFLDAHHSHWCKVTYSSYPAGQSWAKFKIENRNGRFFFSSSHYQNLCLDEYESWTFRY